MGSPLLVWVPVSLGVFFLFSSLPVACDDDGGVNRGTSPPPLPPKQPLRPPKKPLLPPPKPPPPSPRAPRPPSLPKDKNAFHHPPSYPSTSIQGGNSNIQNKRGVTSKSSERKRNLGRKVGLTFVGIAGVLQVFVVAFLLIKRRQMLTTTNGSF